MDLLKTPKENIAQNQVISLTDAQLKIKVAIVEDLTNGVPKGETEAKIRAIISEAIKVSGIDKEVAKVSLQVLAKNNYWLLSRDLKAIKNGYKKEIKKVVPGFEPSGVDFQKELERFRPYLDTAPKGLAVIEDYRKKVQMELRALASEPAMAQEVSKKDGRVVNYSLRNYAEMKVRYEANLKDIEKLKSEGEDLVWTSSHADASLRCSIWQGRLYSIQGNKGVVDGIEYSPLDEAMAGEDGDGNGIITGYNCRHRLIKYEPKSKPPTDYDEKTMKRERAVDQRQRRYENDIRQLKMQEKLNRAMGDTEIAKELRLRWRKMTADYEAYSFRNGRAFYRWRTIVDKEELNA